MIFYKQANKKSGLIFIIVVNKQINNDIDVEEDKDERVENGEKFGVFRKDVSDDISDKQGYAQDKKQSELASIDSAVSTINDIDTADGGNDGKD